MWTCPSCAQTFTRAHAWHSCHVGTEASFLEGRPEAMVRTYKALRAALLALGDVTPRPVRTRVAFQARTRFASVNRVTDDHLDVHVVLRRRAGGPCVRRVEEVGGVFVVHLRLCTPEDVERVRSLLREAHQEYGR